MKLLFPYLAQAHQILHSLPIAAAVALEDPTIEVYIAAVEPAQLDFVRRLLARHAPRAPVQYRLLPLGPGDALRLRLGLGGQHFKQYALLRNRSYFRRFDAIVTPERTSLFLKDIGVRTPLIWTRHGAGDREIGFADDVAGFDYVLMAGPKIEARLLAEGLIRTGGYASGIYAKFDWARSAGPRLFDNGRPTVLYNPHFRPALSSWPRFGEAVLDSLAASTRYNLIFAPHVRLFAPGDAARRTLEARYHGLPHVLIDCGSERSIDMSYTQAADLYLGDVSSQVAEFAVRPRPCVFLDAHATAWQDDPNYESWQLGPVLDTVAELPAQLDQAFFRHRDYAARQTRYAEETFGLPPGPSAPRAARAILDFLRGSAASD